VSVMMPADRVSTHDLPLAESLSALGVEREKYHIYIYTCVGYINCNKNTYNNRVIYLNTKRNKVINTIIK